MRMPPQSPAMPAALLVLCLVSAYKVLGQQNALSAKLSAQGGIRVMAGEKLLATLSLNAHGPAWKNVDQAAATALIRDAETGPAKVVEGSLPVPDTDGGAVRFVETIAPAEKGFTVAYGLGYTKAMTLNGLQVSLLLSAEAFAGKSVILHMPGEKPREVPLPEKLNGDKWQLGDGIVSSVEIAPGTDSAITIAPRLPEAKPGEKPQSPRFIVQDLRKWDKDVFEVRLVLVFDEKGKQVSAEDKANTEFRITFARPLQWQ